VALKFETGFLTSPGATGNQTVSLIDTGFGTVKALLLRMGYATVEADSGADEIMCLGLGTYRGAVVQQHVVAFWSANGVGTSATARCSRSDGILRGFLDAAAGLDFAATLVSLDDAQFVLNWSDLPATASIKIQYAVFGGADITDAQVVTFNAVTGTPPYNQDVTIASGFGPPDLLLAVGADGTADTDVASHAQLTFGVGKSDTEQGGSGYVEEDARPNMELASFQEAGFLREMHLDSAARVDADLVARASWPTDGFRITHQVDAGVGGGSARIGVLALRGTFTSVIGSGTAPTAAPPVTQDLAVGATPRGAIFFHNALPVTAGIDNTSASLGLFGFGAMDGTREGWGGVSNDDGNTSSQSIRHHSESKTIRMFTPGAVLTSEADGSFSGNNVRLTWTDTNTVAREYRHLLLGDAVAAEFIPRHPAHDHGSVTIF